jgi:dinuclear metal center YbgI/SA1388 family protein
MAIEQNDLFQIFDLIAPPNLAESWDNVGPQIVPNPIQDISKVLLCLDCYEPVIKEALSIGAELIVSHHPLIFSPLSTFIHNHYPCTLIHEIIRSGISLFVMHTNLDKAIGGVNDHLAAIAGLKGIAPLTSHSAGDDPNLSEIGLGRIGNLSEPKKVADLCRFIKKRLGLHKIRFVGDPDLKVKRLAVCSGSGASLLDEASKQGAQALLTGDVKYHQAREAQGVGIVLIDAGHFATERIILPALKERLTEMVREKGDGTYLEIHISHTEEDPFQDL